MKTQKKSALRLAALGGALRMDAVREASPSQAAATMITTNDPPPRGAEPLCDDYQATWRAAQTVYHLGQVESEAERLIQQAEL